jgi:energy-coupling factor transporter ATP-binding protein EcfA2
MSLLETVVEWGQSLPAWQSDAVRRILTQKNITDIDIAELTIFLRSKYGLIDEGERVPEIKPTKRGEISGAGGLDKVTLKAIKKLHNVNMLPDDSSLLFCHKGLTVIYGENGTGKSGYARVLKRACHARDTEDILPNVFSTNKIGSARAHFKVSVNDKEYPDIEWIDSEKDNSILSNICVFDSKCARVIVNEKNEISYLPYGADVFQKLAEVLLKVRQSLQEKCPDITPLEYPDIKEGTKAAEFLSNLSSATKEHEIEQATSWTESDEKALKKLNQAIATAEAENPLKYAQKIRNLKGRVSIFKGKLEGLHTSISKHKEDQIKEQISNFNAAKKAFEEVSSEDFSKEPLVGIGSNEWQILYKAAKEYSIKYPYPNEEFPYIGKNSLCVLCLQPLSEEAQVRFSRFKVFMEQKTKKEFESAEANLTQTLNDLRNIDFKIIKEFKDALDEIKTKKPEFGRFLQDNFMPNLRKRASDLIRLARNKYDRDIFKVEENPKVVIEAIEQDLEQEAEQMEKNAEPEEIDKTRKQRDELQARELLSKRKNNIIEYRENLQLQKKYDKCIKETDTTKITRRGKEIISNALTSGLQDSLKQELVTLGVDYLPLNLKPHGEYGTTCHQIELDGCTSLPAHLTDILSEGEQNIVAIAGFLAELNVCGHKNPIVLDDPVCSFDHKYSEKIAKRLVQESTKRQIIIFTHDISFLLDLQGKSESQGMYCHCVNVHREGAFSGVTRGEEPWHAMSVSKRLNFIEQELTKIVNLFPDNQQEYNKQVAILYDYLRETWEAAIEECLFFKVIGRFQPGVKTDRLREVYIDKSDCDLIVEEWEKCSKWMIGHSLSRQISDNRPSPNEFQEDIKKLRNFDNSMRSKRKISKNVQKITIPEIG